MFRRILIWSLAGFAVSTAGGRLLAQSTALAVSSATGSPGGTATLALSLSASGTLPAGLQWTFSYPPADISGISVTAGPVAAAAGKTASCGSNSGAYTCVLSGLNANTMASGVAAFVQFTLAPNATSGTVGILNPVGVDAGGSAISVSPAGSGVILIPTVTSVICNTTSLNANGTSNCSVNLNTAAPSGGATVALSSNNALLTVPASVLVSSGATTASFTASAAATVPSNQSATVTATLGASSQTAVINLQAPGLVSGLACNPTSLGQSASATCAVTLTQTAPAGGSSVTLASNNASLTVPASVTVAAGATTATFSATAAATIASNQNATVTATLGSSSQTATISLLAQVLLSGISCNPTSLGQSAVSTCTVTLTQTAPPGGSSVTLASNNASLTVPASVTVAAGATTATFSATAVAAIQSTQSAIITATLGSSSQTLTISLQAQTLVQVSGLACNPTSLGQSATSTCTVTLTQTAPTGGATVTLSTNNTLLTVPASVTVPSGSTTATFTATAAASIATNQSATLTVSLNGSGKTVTISLISGTGGSGSTGGSGGSGGSAGSGGSGGSTANGHLSLSPTSLTINVPESGASGMQPITLTYTAASQGNYTFSANQSLNEGTGWLAVSPSGAAMTQVSYDGSVYTYQATVMVTVNPSSNGTGTYTGTIAFSLSQLVASSAVTMNVTSQPAQLTVGPTSLSFNYQQGDSAPASQALSVFTNPTGSTFSATVNQNGQNWLSLGAPGNNTPVALPVSVNPASLAAGQYAAEITISSADGGPINVLVTLTVTSAPAKLTLDSQQESFALVQGSGPTAGQVVVMNSGGGTLQFTAQASASQGNWLNLNGAASGAATSSAPAALGFTLNPAGLSPGVYTGQITVQDTASGNQKVAAIILAVSQASQMLTVSQSGLTFTAVQGNADPPAQTLTVSSQGTNASQWTAQANVVPNPLAPQVNWLVSTITPGTSPDGTANATVTVVIHRYGLPPGQYYGSIAVTAPDVPNSPQIVSVLLNVLPSAQTGSDITLSTAGVLLTAGAGSKTPQQQQVTVFNLTNASMNYSATTFSATGTGWLSVSPSIGELLPGANLLTLQADFSGLTAGVQSGTVALGLGDGTVQPIQVTAVATATTGSATGTAYRPITQISVHNPKAVATGCLSGRPSALVTVFDEPMDHSVLRSSVGQTVRVQGLDDCGSPLSRTRGDAIQVVFGNHDAPLTLHDIGGGVWEGTWVPMHPAALVSLSAVAYRSNTLLSSVGAPVYTAVQSAPASAAAQISGVVNAALSAQAMPGIVTPGGYIAIYGSNVASGAATSAGVTPLPTNLNGTQLLIGNQPLPILYASATQVNALVPQNLTPNTTYQLTIINGSTQSVPLSLTVADLQPGIYTADLSGSGQGVVEIAGTTLLAAPAGGSSRPAQSGSDYLQVFCTGLGPVVGSNGETAPGDGAAAPTTTIYQTNATVTATIGGVNAPVVFSGLTPTLVGLYQVNVQVPVGAPRGDAVPLVLSVTDPQTGAILQSNSVSIAVQ